MQAPRFERAFKWKHWIFFVLFSQTPTCLREPASTGSQIHVKVSHTVISKFGAINDCSNEIVYPYFRKCLKIFLTKFPPSYSSNLHLVWFKVCFKFLDRNQSKWGILTYIYINISLAHAKSWDLTSQTWRQLCGYSSWWCGIPAASSPIYLGQWHLENLKKLEFFHLKWKNTIYI